MGYSSYSSDAADSLRSSYKSMSTDDIFTSRSVTKDMTVTDTTLRESRDSDTHPESVAIMVFLDVTGSMHRIPEIIVKEKFGVLMDTIIENGIPHPQILFGAIGDHWCDRSPLQVGQYESGTAELDKWLTSIHLEGGGGGQNKESYLLAWLMGGRHTSIDCFEKRNTKGFLFTIGDEKSWDKVDADHLKKLLGYAQSDDVTDTQLLEEAQRMYNVYHIHINEASYKDDPDVLGYWRKLLGERLIVLNDFQAICETIATLIVSQHGADMDAVLSKFDSHTAATVKNALVNIPKNVAVATNGTGVTNL